MSSANVRPARAEVMLRLALVLGSDDLSTCRVLFSLILVRRAPLALSHSTDRPPRRVVSCWLSGVSACLSDVRVRPHRLLDRLHRLVVCTVAVVPTRAAAYVLAFATFTWAVSLSVCRMTYRPLPRWFREWQNFTALPSMASSLVLLLVPLVLTTVRLRHGFVPVVVRVLKTVLSLVRNCRALKGRLEGWGLLLVRLGVVLLLNVVTSPVTSVLLLTLLFRYEIGPH